MSEKNVLFRSAIGGYNRSDVHNYISKTDTEHNAVIEQLKDELQKRDDQLSELRSELELLRIGENENERLSSALNEKNAALDECSAKLSEAEAIISAQNELIEKQKSNFAALEVELNELRKKLSELEYAGENLKSITEKAKRYDEMSREYGAAILEARSAANVIISDAQLEADLIKNDAVEAVRDIKENAHRQIEATLEGTDNSFKAMIVNFVEEYTNYANKIHHDLDSIITGAKSRVDDISYTIPAELIDSGSSDVPVNGAESDGEK